jgi:hypothetical protein
MVDGDPSIFHIHQPLAISHGFVTAAYPALTTFL